MTSLNGPFFPCTTLDQFFFLRSVFLTPRSTPILQADYPGLPRLLLPMNLPPCFFWPMSVWRLLVLPLLVPPSSQRLFHVPTTPLLGTSPRVQPIRFLDALDPESPPPTMVHSGIEVTTPSGAGLLDRSRHLLSWSSIYSSPFLLPSLHFFGFCRASRPPQIPAAPRADNCHGRPF